MKHSKPMYTFKPTQQQIDILEALQNNRVMKVNAVAGSGKTSTIELLSKANVRPSLLVAFNKTIVEQARERLPDHVSCLTIHSMAYKDHGRKLQHKLRYNTDYRINTMRSIKETISWFGLEDYLMSSPAIPARTIASLAKATVSRFCDSASDFISKKDVPQAVLKDLTKNYDFDTEDLSKVIVNLAVNIWSEMINPSSQSYATHDTYLKLWSLSRPTLEFEIIYVDEAQDINPCILKVLEQQNCKMVYVGDQYQSIYAFRGAINAMSCVEGTTLHLSQSWRYGEAIANIAERILRKHKVDVKGNPSIESNVVHLLREEKYTTIFRTNSALLEYADKLISQGTSISIEIDISNFIRQVRSAVLLYKGKSPTHDMFVRFNKWSDFLEYAEEDIEAKRLARIAVRSDVDRFIERLEKVKECKNPSVILTTAHKSKGLEFDNVIVYNDFKFGEKDLLDMPEQELNLLYVACTRAKKKLQLPDALQSYMEVSDEV